MDFKSKIRVNLVAKNFLKNRIYFTDDLRISTTVKRGGLDFGIFNLKDKTFESFSCAIPNLGFGSPLKQNRTLLIGIHLYSLQKELRLSFVVVLLLLYKMIF